MKKLLRKHSNFLLLVGVWVNRNWILGNWIKEVNSRYRSETKIHWVASVFAGKHVWEKLVRFPLPNYGSYFFSYPAMFESYLNSNPKRFAYKSIVNYTHNMDELGTLKHQAIVLNKAYSVHFNCSRDAENLIMNGLRKEKVRIVYGAIDEDCQTISAIAREPKTVVLASLYSERKGLNILPSIIEQLPDWKFLVLGRGWESFIEKNQLLASNRFEYFFFNKTTRNEIMSRGTVFLSLSSLEGGPIPLLEAMKLNLIPVSTDTGFARDFIENGQNGFLLSNPTNLTEVCNAIRKTEQIKPNTRERVEHLTWDRLSDLIIRDSRAIREKNS